MRLYAESFAPWCEKARWALDHHRVAYAYSEHIPLVSELPLRMAARRWRGPVTVPLLVDGASAIMNSTAIARFAERNGDGPTLFPAGLDAEIKRWDARSESIMSSGRAMLLRRLQRDREALGEQLPAAVPARLRPTMRFVAAFGVEYLARKYAIDLDAPDPEEPECRAALDAVRDALGSAGTHLTKAFSFADVTIAAALQFVLPVDQRFMPIGPATRRAWTHEALASEYADLLAWRDQVYRAHRRTPSDARPRLPDTLIQ